MQLSMLEWMIRQNKTEILEEDGISEELVERAYRDLARNPLVAG